MVQVEGEVQLFLYDQCDIVYNLNIIIIMLFLYKYIIHVCTLYS